jgi:hypothetical protein
MEDKDRDLLIEMKVSMSFIADNVSRLEGALDTRLKKLEDDVKKRLDSQDQQLSTINKIIWGFPATLVVALIGLWMTGGVTLG